ncbi:LysE/ArgO family amino acid transporter [Neisseriaceae bacterium JH1-16]|nr:LysE/ArgO family amino acid transporter [Neisseriaceae bacterium JH1-16]
MFFNPSVYLSALMLSAGQIIGIGPQNAFVIKQGLGRSHVMPIVLICIVCDVLLMSAGVFGMGSLIGGLPLFVKTVTWLGAAFMFWLGYKAFRAALTPSGLALGDSVERDRKAVIRTILAVTLLNPYVWLDTVVLIGSLSSAYGPGSQLSFILGSVTASITWFVAIGFCAGKLAPLFEKPTSWRVLDLVIGCVMLLTGFLLLRNFGFQ